MTDKPKSDEERVRDLLRRFMSDHESSEAAKRLDGFYGWEWIDELQARSDRLETEVITAMERGMRK